MFSRRGISALFYFCDRMADADYTEILKGLADRSRMRLVKELVAGDRHVNDLATNLGLSQYNVSKHLRVLRHAGIVGVRSLGTRREYFIAPTIRSRLNRKGTTLDFGCCTFHLDRLEN